MTSKFKGQYLGCVDATSAHMSDEECKSAIDALVRAGDATKAVVEVNEDGVLGTASKTKAGLFHVERGAMQWSFFDANSKHVAMTAGPAGSLKCYVFHSKAGKQMHHLLKGLFDLSERQQSFTRQSTDSSGGAGDVGIFEAWYLGAIPVNRKAGDAVVEQALTFVQQQVQDQGLMSVGSNVTVIISTEGIRSLDLLTRAAISNTYIKNISFATVVVINDGEEREIFSCISHDYRLNRSCCYLYVCPPRQAELMCQNICKAVEQQSTADNQSDVFATSNKAGRDLSHEVPVKLLHKYFVRESLTEVKSIGIGKFGMVVLASYIAGEEDAASGEEVDLLAVKMLRDTASAHDRKSFLQQADVMLNFGHENIVKLIGLCVLELPWLAIHEFMQYGDLRSVLQAAREKGVAISSAEQASFAQQIASGMAHVHSKGHVLMDLSTKNLLLHSANRIKISDFALAQPYDEGTSHYVLKSRLKLSLRWLAVETYTANPKIFSEASDVWAYGVTLWEILTYGETPYGSFRLNEVHKNVPQGLRPERPEECPDSLWNMLVSCWSTDSTQRPNFSALESKTADVLEELTKHGATLEDVGEKLNAALSVQLRRLSVRAAVKKRQVDKVQRKASLVEQFHLAAGAENGSVSLYPVKRTNPLYQDEDSLETLEEGEELADDDEGDGGLSAALHIDPELRKELDTLQRTVFQPPPGSMVVGDVNGNSKGGGSKPVDHSFAFLPKQSNQCVLMLPENDNPEQKPTRADLLKRTPSKEALMKDRNTFIPDDRAMVG